MNGIFLSAIFITAIILLYLLLQVIACVRARKHRVQRGTVGLPDVDTFQPPRTRWTELGDICYVLYRFSCRICPTE